MNLHLPKIIAHRGASAYAPENTLIAFKKAAEMGSHWVEFDVKLTADEQLIVFHDEELNRTTDGTGLVENYCLIDIKELDAGSWFANEFTGEKVPTFRETIQTLSECHLGANVEIKPNPGQEKKTAIYAWNMIKKYWPSSIYPPLISSFSRDSLQAIRALSKKARLGLLLDRWSKNLFLWAEELDCVSIHLNHQTLTQKKIKLIKQGGYYLLVYTVDDVERAQELFDWGVDAIFSNVPDLLTNIVCQ